MLIIVLIIALPRIFNYLAKRYTGKDVDIETAVDQIQTKTNRIADAIASSVLTKTDPEVQKNIRKDIPDVLHYLVFSRLRGTGLRFLMTVFAAIGGIMGTILLYHQNELLTGQNELLNSQNEKIDNQILLDEASRRSSLNFLMANVLDKIDEELKEAERNEEPRQLSTQLIGRIASLSQSFQPYRFIQDGQMLEKPLSPERGNLLLALVNSSLDTFTMDSIFMKTIFREANLKSAILNATYLSGADLRGADLSGVDLSGADLSGVNLNGANLSGTNLSGTNLSRANLAAADLSEAILIAADLSGASLWGANLSEASFIAADLRGVNLYEADLRGANFSEANFSEANFSEANFSEARNLSLNQLRGAYSLYGCTGLDHQIEEKLASEKKCLFERYGCK